MLSFQLVKKILLIMIQKSIKLKLKFQIYKNKSNILNFSFKHAKKDPKIKLLKFNFSLRRSKKKMRDQNRD